MLNTATSFSRLRILASVALLAMPLPMTACTTASAPEAMPLPQLTFDHVRPLMVNVSRVNVDNRFQPGTDMRDVSENFPTPPDMALEQYVRQRLQPLKDNDNSVLNVVIEDTHVYQSEIKADGFVNRWSGMNDKDHYDVYMAILLYKVNANGQESSQVRLNFDGDLDIPQRYSMAKREEVQFKFLETFMQNVDKAFVKALNERLYLLSPGADTSLYTHSVAPLEPAPIAGDVSGQYPLQDERDYEAYDSYGADQGAIGAPQSLSPPEMR